MGECPVAHNTNVDRKRMPVAGYGTKSSDWWPNELRLNILRQHQANSIPSTPSSTTPRLQEP